MKIHNVLYVLVMFLFIACGGDSADDATAKTSETTDQFNVSNAGDVGLTPPPTPPTQEPAQNADGVWHYTCANGCAGGGGSATACGVCGSTLQHNAAYHQPAGAAAPGQQSISLGEENTTTIQQIQNNAPQTSGSTPPQILGNNNSNINFTPPATEPAQNANGVWHYICSKGCTGGGGSAIACGGCGETLVHNAAYHQ